MHWIKRWCCCFQRVQPSQSMEPCKQLYERNAGTTTSGSTSHDAESWRRRRDSDLVDLFFPKSADRPSATRYLKWSREQDICAAEMQGRSVAYYGPIDGVVTFQFSLSENGRRTITAWHSVTKSQLVLGQTCFQVESLMTTEQAQQFKAWLQGQALVIHPQNSSPGNGGDFVSAVTLSITFTSLGIVLKAFNPQSRDTIDLSDYDDW